MHSRLNVIGFDPEAIPAALSRYRAGTLPMIQSWPGYVSTVAMAQRTTGKVMMMSLWESAEARDASGLRVDYVQDLASYGHMITGSMVREAHEVAVSTFDRIAPEAGHQRNWARVTIGHVPPEHWDDAIAMLTPIVEDEGDNPAHQGSMMLANRTLSKLVVIGFWESRRSILMTDDEIHAQAYRVRRNGFLTASPTHEVFEVVDWS